MLDIFTMLSLGMWPWDNSSYHIAGAVLLKVIIVVIATGQAYQFPGFLQLPYSSSGAYPTRLEQLLQYQLGVESPMRVLLPTLHQELPTNYFSEDI